MDEYEFEKKQRKEKYEKGLNDKRLIDSYVIKLNEINFETPKEEIIDLLNLLISYSKKYSISLTSNFLSYNFIPNLINLLLSPDSDIAIAAATFLLQASVDTCAEITKYILSEKYFEKIISCILVQNQKFLLLIFKLIINFLIDFPNESSEAIYSNPSVLENLLMMLSDTSLQIEHIKLIIEILKYASKGKGYYEQKQMIIKRCVELFEDELYKSSNLIPQLMSIPESMIINSEISNLIFNTTPILQICQEFLRSDDENLIIAAIRCVGRHYLYSNEYICFDCLKVLRCAEFSKNDELVHISLWFLNLILAINTEEISKIEAYGDIYRILTSIFESGRSTRCKFEASSGMRNIILNGNKEQIKKAIKSNFISYLLLIAEYQNDTDERFAGNAIRAIQYLLCDNKFVNNTDLKNICNCQFYENDGMEIVERLTQSKNKYTADISMVFLRKLKSK